MSNRFKFKCPYCGCSQLCVEKETIQSTVYAALDTMSKDASGNPVDYMVQDGDAITADAVTDSTDIYFCYNCLHEFSDPARMPELFTEEV